MATIPHSKKELNPDTPDGFHNETNLDLYLRYRLDSAGKPMFGYKLLSYPWDQEMLAADEAKTTQAAADPARVSWSEYLYREDFVQQLDIEIDSHTTITVECDSGSDLFWSLLRNAVMTEDDRQEYYGDLRYRLGGRWKKSPPADIGECRAIRFKAKHAPHPPKIHKFSYNVRYRDAGRDLVDFEIDPDIKNPSL